MIKYEDVVCDGCGEKFSKRSSILKYEKKKGQKTFFCSKECRYSFIKQQNVYLTCDSCGVEFKRSVKDHNKSIKKGKDKSYCSKSCANRDRKCTEKQKQQISIKLKSYYKENVHHGKQKGIDKVCPICSTEFNVSESEKHRIFCSRECCDNDKDFKYKKKASGGYRHGSGRSKGGWYKGIYCDSTYELAYLIYCLDHDIDIRRYDGYFEYGEGKKYYPDFLVEGAIIEIKGYVTEEVYEKMKSIPDELEYHLLTKEMLTKEFEYINVKYGKNKNKIHELYDNYKPQYSYVCDSCNTLFDTNRKRKTKHKFCSRKCSGNYTFSSR